MLPALRSYSVTDMNCLLVSLWRLLLRMQGLSCLLLALPAHISAQDIRVWGEYVHDSRLLSENAVDIAAYPGLSLSVTASGHLAECGATGHVPPLPAPGTRFVRCVVGPVSLALQSDGSLISWGPNPVPSVPSLPTGQSWISMDVNDTCAFGVRSDGAISSWISSAGGLSSVPALGPGLGYSEVAAGSWFAVARVSDGTLRVWGAWAPLVSAIPTLPLGERYTKVDAGVSYVVALRSDGQVLAWGDNSLGQCLVPALPQGVSYTDIAAGSAFAAARRSDGVWVAWGDNASGQCNLPTPSNGLPFIKIACGAFHGIALQTDGRVRPWGEMVYRGPGALLQHGQEWLAVDVCGPTAASLRDDGRLERWTTTVGVSLIAPTLPSGVRYVDCCQGWDFSLGQCSDGTLRAWGSNGHGQLSIPPLPAGVTYCRAEVGSMNCAALRSDGAVVGWGDNSFGQATIPLPAPGTSYLDFGVGPQNVILLRSDGVLVHVGLANGLTPLPQPPAGTAWRKVTCGRLVAAALASDGTITAWGPAAYTMPPWPVGSVPPLPSGVVYVDVVCGDQHTTALRSDGAVVSWPVNDAPIVPNNRSFIAIRAGFNSNVGLVGSLARYSRTAQGCPGSAGIPSLVPCSTPQIGKTLRVNARALPIGVALIAFSWQAQATPVSLAGLGMPGCDLHVFADAVFALAGNQSEVPIDVVIPRASQLRGVRFYNQMLVLDPSANAFGAVMSDAMEALIGG